MKRELQFILFTLMLPALLIINSCKKDEKVNRFEEAPDGTIITTIKERDGLKERRLHYTYTITVSLGNGIEYCKLSLNNIEGDILWNQEQVKEIRVTKNSALTLQFLPFTPGKYTIELNIESNLGKESKKIIDVDIPHIKETSLLSNMKMVLPYKGYYNAWYYWGLSQECKLESDNQDIITIDNHFITSFNWTDTKGCWVYIIKPNGKTGVYITKGKEWVDLEYVLWQCVPAGIPIKGKVLIYKDKVPIFIPNIKYNGEAFFLFKAIGVYPHNTSVQCPEILIWGKPYSVSYDLETAWEDLDKIMRTFGIDFNYGNPHLMPTRYIDNNGKEVTAYKPAMEVIFPEIIVDENNSKTSPFSVKFGEKKRLPITIGPEIIKDSITSDLYNIRIVSSEKIYVDYSQYCKIDKDFNFEWIEECGDVIIYFEHSKKNEHKCNPIYITSK